MELAGEDLASGEADELAGNDFPVVKRGAEPSAVWEFEDFEKEELDEEGLGSDAIAGSGCDGD